MSLIVETDLGQILQKIDRKLDSLEDKIDVIKDEITGVKIYIVKLEGDIKALESKVDGNFKVLDTKVDGLSKRADNQEFTSRAILTSLVVVILGAFIKMFGFLPSSIS